MMSKWFSSTMKQVLPLCLPLIVTLTYAILYLPIIVLVIFSFNNASFSYSWHGFSLRWYYELYASVEVWNALCASLIIACCAVVLSITLSVLFICYSSPWFLKRGIIFFYATLAAPEIVLAIGLISLFSFFSVPLGITSLIVAHTLLGMGYVVPLVYSRFSELDDRLTQASLDLGATRMQTFFNITVPSLFPALLASALLVFIISLDDFLLSFFCSGASTLTLPMYIFSVLRTGATPLVNALSTVLLCMSSLCVMVFSSLHVKSKMR
jgi:spermidine/putrescine transport system permease protein